ncbi:MAG TPA: SCO family protein [Steroidobacteraceae bacterium]|nr:SCO family protein [Steroidobacteraceae bacterium]
MPRSWGWGVSGAGLGAAVCYWMVANQPLSDARLLAELARRPEFIADHPDLVEQTEAVLHTRALVSQGNERASLIRGKWSAATEVAFAPTLGKLGASNVIVEFTDYTCAPCRESMPAIEAVIKSNPDIRVAVLFVPIGGPIAEYAAQVAFAAYRQNPDLFPAMHRQLMRAGANLTPELVLSIAKSAGYDIAQIQREQSAGENRRYMDTARAFAKDLQITGVPAFAAGTSLVMGGVDVARLRKLVAAARAPLPSQPGPAAVPAQPQTYTTQAQPAVPARAASAAPPRPFQLTDQDGRARTDASFRGSWVVLMFGYTHCPDICPTTLIRLSAAVKELGSENKRVRIAFVTVDPERDKPADLTRYVTAFGADITGLTGTPAQVAAVLKTFNAYAAKEAPGPDGSYSVDHSSLLYVLDPNGRLYRQLSEETSATDLAATLRAAMGSPVG